MSNITLIFLAVGVVILWFTLASVCIYFIRSELQYSRPNYFLIAFVIAFLCLLIAIAVAPFTTPTLAQTYEMPTNTPHNPRDPNHWYPEHCCSLNDCEPTPIDAINETEMGWEISYYSKRFDQQLEGFISHKDPKVQPSQDGQFHACWVIKHPDRNGDQSVYEGAPGYGGFSPIRCFFQPHNI